MIRAIIFDIGGVLIDDPTTQMVTYYAHVLQVDREWLVEALSTVWAAWHTGSLTEQEVWKRVTDDLKLPSFSSNMGNTGDSLWLEGFKHAYRERPEMFALLRNVKQQGYTTALLSNTELPIMNYLKRHSYEHIDTGVYSCEAGVSKPDRAIYETTLQRLGVLARDAIFIDDRNENVDGAVNAGIHSILYQDIDDLKQHFRDLGIKL